MASFEILNSELRIKKSLTKLDKFVIGTIKIIEKYADYVIISGYVSIFFGRARATEDVDIFISGVSKENFNKLYSEALSKGYEFNIDNPEELFNEYLKAGLSINLWEKNFPLIRLEIKFTKNLSQQLSIKNKIKVYYNGDFLYFTPIEYQIIYKRVILKSDKDLEDARHLEIVFKNLNEKVMEDYKKLVIKEFNDE